MNRIILAIGLMSLTFALSPQAEAQKVHAFPLLGIANGQGHMASMPIEMYRIPGKKYGHSTSATYTVQNDTIEIISKIPIKASDAEQRQELTVRSHVSSGDEFTLTIFDAQGEQAVVRALNRLDANEHINTIDLKSLSPGSYRVQLNTVNGMFEQKFEIIP